MKWGTSGPFLTCCHPSSGPLAWTMPIFKHKLKALPVDAVLPVKITAHPLTLGPQPTFVVLYAPFVFFSVCLCVCVTKLCNWDQNEGSTVQPLMTEWCYINVVMTTEHSRVRKWTPQMVEKLIHSVAHHLRQCLELCWGVAAQQPSFLTHNEMCFMWIGRLNHDNYKKELLFCFARHVCVWISALTNKIRDQVHPGVKWKWKRFILTL